MQTEERYSRSSSPSSLQSDRARSSSPYPFHPDRQDPPDITMNQVLYILYTNIMYSLQWTLSICMYGVNYQGLLIGKSDYSHREVNILQQLHGSKYLNAKFIFLQITPRQNFPEKGLGQNFPTVFHVLCSNSKLFLFSMCVQTCAWTSCHLI